MVYKGLELKQSYLEISGTPWLESLSLKVDWFVNHLTNKDE